MDIQKQRRSIFNEEQIAAIEKIYSSKKKCLVKYVCDSCLETKDGGGFTYCSYAIFYSEKPYPENGSHYFGLHTNELGKIYVINAEGVEKLKFHCIDGPKGYVHSNHRHDFVELSDGRYIDGGRDYARSNTDTVILVVRNGEFKRDSI